MISIGYDNNLEKKHKDLLKMSVVNAESKVVAGNKIGSFLMKKVRTYIESSGEGSWEATHPLTLEKSKETAYHWLGKMTRYKIKNRGKSIEIGFGQFTARDVRKGNDLNFDSKLNKVSNVMQLGKKFRTSKRMQRKLGSARRNAYSQPGIDFFPIKNTTKVLEIPSRPVMKPVLEKNKTQVENLYKDKFNKVLEKGFERL